MIAQKILKPPKARVASQKSQPKQGKRPSTSPPEQAKVLPAHETSMLPEIHMAEPLDLDDVLADLSDHKAT